MRQSKLAKRRKQFARVLGLWMEDRDCPEALILNVQPDRAVVDCTTEWISWLNRNFDRWNAGISKHVAPGFQEWIPVRGWRERGTPWVAAQAIQHCRSGYASVLEIDFDLANPNEGLLPLIMHGVEYARYRIPKLFGGEKATTNPYRVEEWMKWKKKSGQ